MDLSGLHTTYGLLSVFSAEIPAWSGRDPVICRIGFLHLIWWVSHHEPPFDWSVLVQLWQGIVNATVISLLWQSWFPKWLRAEDSPLDSIDSMNSNDFTRFLVHAWFDQRILALIIDWLPLIWDFGSLIASRISEFTPWFYQLMFSFIIWESKQGPKRKDRKNKGKRR